MPYKWDLEKVKNFVATKNFVLLSSEYINTKTPLKLRCENGHEIEISMNNFRINGKCKFCTTRWCLGDIKKKVESLGGKLLSRKFGNVHFGLSIECQKGHITQSCLSYMLKYNRISCMTCGKNSQKLNLDTISTLVEPYGGKCLEKEYINARTKMKFICKFGHEFTTTVDSITTKKSWCPKCRVKSAGEEICRIHFEKIFGKAFPSCKPSWLLNNSGNCMELDGYCKELDIAFEFHGQQHYYDVPYYYKKGKTLEKRQQDDKLKETLCKQKGINLIIIPYNINFKNLKDYILNKFPLLEKDFNKEEVHWKNAIIFSRHEKSLNLMQEIAAKHEGKCLSENYINARTKMSFICKKGHVFEKVPDVIKNQNKWCPKCRDKSN
jgi:hypothetical protein